MNFIDFKQQLEGFTIFSKSDVEKYYPDFNKMNFITWQKKNYISKLRNGKYRFDKKITNETELFYIANKIYTPSYISLETALNYYGLIPEAVFSIQSVSTLKTQSFENIQGLFNYSNIKSNYFFGYRLISTENYTFKIADIEKTLLDFLYLRNSIKTIEDVEGLRLNKIILKEKISIPKLDQYTTYMNSKLLHKKITLLKSCLYD